MIALVISLVVLIGLLVTGDRVAAAYAADRIAQQLQTHGFPSKPQVTVEGFPFLTQVAGRRLRDVRISSNSVREGPVKLRVVADATGIVLDSGYKSGTISQVNGTGLIAFSNLASVVSAAGAPGVKFTAAGPDRVKMAVDLAVITATAYATIQRTGADTFRIHITSAGGIPASLLGTMRNFTVHIPALPLGLSIRSVGVSQQGILIQVSGRDVPFGR